MKLNKILLFSVLFLFAATLSADFAIDGNRFKTSPFTDGFITVYGSEGLEEGLFGLDFIMNYQHEPIVVSGTKGKNKVIANQLAADISFFYSVVKWFDLGVSLPVILFENGDGWNKDDSLAKAGVGDLRLVPRFQLFSLFDKAISMSVITEVTAPTGKQIHSALGSNQFTFRPAIALGTQTKWVDAALNLFYQILPKQTFATSKFDDEFGLKLALNVHAVEKLLDINAEFHSATSIKSPFKNDAQDNIELGGGVRFKTPANVDVIAGAFGGFGNAVAVPKYRIYAGISWNMNVLPPEDERNKEEFKLKKREAKQEEQPKQEEKKPEKKAKKAPKKAAPKQAALPQQPEKTGEKLPNEVHFMHESDYIADPVEIEKVALILTRNFMLKIRIEAHTDKHENKAFAQKRANAVKAVLIKNGVEANRIKIKIIGAAEPVSDGDTEPDMVKNRRVEFFVVTD
ncbi:OmpA family protein [bacterium]|nr:OmpA family protein [bacterium]MBP5591027.1 OmpA family protein [bacterium]